ncbi:S41 family peptidase [Cryptosporangium phraense]|uniref:S41 family peptidase n=2 Tax=Cryptosporangium phraense TaxID=2593070 RepID=A0A545ASR6_9ACTN|nr:S41 family peptidase [Cryptosporangium phraense]
MIDRTIELLDRYVFPDVGAKAATAVRSAQSAGRYPDGLEPDALADLVTEDLQTINGDKHLRLQFTSEALPLSTGDETADEAEERAQEVREAARTGGGFAKVERLDGNVAYLEIDLLWPPEIAAPAATAAMTLADGADGLVLDLRRCRGGSPYQVAFLCSYLFGPEPVHLNDLYFRASDETRQFWTSSFVPGPRFGSERPVVVLTSGSTFSGGEELAWDLKELGRATLIGETTRGGAHPVDRIQVHPHLRVTIPIARSISPRTGRNWEGVGVVPDIEVVASAALDRALDHLRTLTS